MSDPVAVAHGLASRGAVLHAAGRLWPGVPAAAQHYPFICPAPYRPDAEAPPLAATRLPLLRRLSGRLPSTTRRRRRWCSRCSRWGGGSAGHWRALQRAVFAGCPGGVPSPAHTHTLPLGALAAATNLVPHLPCSLPRLSRCPSLASPRLPCRREAQRQRRQYRRRSSWSSRRQRQQRNPQHRLALHRPLGGRARFCGRSAT